MRRMLNLSSSPGTVPRQPSRRSRCTSAAGPAITVCISLVEPHDVGTSASAVLKSAAAHGFAVQATPKHYHLKHPVMYNNYFCMMLSWHVGFSIIRNRLYQKGV